MRIRWKGMVLRVLVLIILVALAPLAYLGVMALSIEPAWVEVQHHFTLKAEHVGEYEQAVMASCRLGGSRTYTAEVDGTEYAIPLPNGSTEFSNEDYPEGEGLKQYMAVSEVFFAYVHEMEHLEGYHFEQLGSRIVLASDDGKFRFGITRRNYARKYELFAIDVYAY